MSRLIIVDGHAIAHRAYHSIPYLTVNGQPVNVIYGFYSMLLSVINALKPDYFIVCLDSPGPTFRNNEFLGYRAQRKIPDKDLITQLPLLKSSLETAKIPTFSMGGYEADDLIASLTKKALRKVRNKHHLISQVTIITGDKDLMQLVDPRVELFVPVKGLSETKIFKTKEVKEKLGVLPSQVIDLKALMGDPSDGYPGVAGIGPKVATNLLSQYKNLDNIYTHIDDLKPAIQEKLINEKENAYLSQKLATLINNIPLDFKLYKTRWNDKTIQNLIEVFKSYNFKSLISRIEKQNHSIQSKKPNDSNQTSLF